MHKFLLTTLSLFLPLALLAQRADSACIAENAAQDSVLRHLWTLSTREIADTVIGEQVQAHLHSRLHNAADLHAPLPSLRGLRDLTASNGRLRLLIWSHTTPQREIIYLGIAAWLDAQDSLRVTNLTDRRLPVGIGLIDERWFTDVYTPESWIGASYYDAFPFKWQEGQAYLLLGVAGSTPLVARRIIETLFITPEGDLQFGIPCISYRQHRFSRLLFSHSARVAMTLHLIDPRGRVLIDHLSPSKPQFAGLPEHYGPDFSQDDLTLQEYGVWQYNFDVVALPPDPSAQ